MNECFSFREHKGLAVKLLIYVLIYSLNCRLQLYTSKTEPCITRFLQTTCLKFILSFSFILVFNNCTLWVTHITNKLARFYSVYYTALVTNSDCTPPQTWSGPAVAKSLRQPSVTWWSQQEVSIIVLSSVIGVHVQHHRVRMPIANLLIFAAMKSGCYTHFVSKKH